MSLAEQPVAQRLSAGEANDRFAVGQTTAYALEPKLARQYEASLLATGRRCVAAYRARTQVLTAAMPPKPEGTPQNISQPPQPTVDEVLDAALAAGSAEARTLAIRRRISAAVAGEILSGFGAIPELRPLLEPMVRAQAGAQAERLVAGTRDAVANVLLDALVEGWSVGTTAEYLGAVLKEQAKWRAVMLARTDLISLSNGAAQDAVLVLGSEGPQFKTWLSAGDERVRQSHQDANRETVGVGEPFNVGGAMLQYPGDPLGPDDETINCFPGDTLVSAANLEGAIRGWYEGDLIRLITDGGDVLSGTPNHPVLTDSGFKPLGLLEQGDRVFRASLRESRFASVHPNVQNAPAEIEKVFTTLAVTGAIHRVTGAVDLYGDPITGDIDVVAPLGKLVGAGVSPFREPGDHFTFSHPVVGEGALLGERPQGHLAIAPRHATNSFMGRSAPGLPFLGGSVLHTDEHCPTPVAGFDAVRGEDTPDDVAGDFEFDSDVAFRDAFEVSATDVVLVERVPNFAGHVYTLSTEEGIYVAGSIVVSNCRCVHTFSDTANPVLRHSFEGGNLMSEQLAVAASINNEGGHREGLDDETADSSERVALMAGGGAASGDLEEAERQADRALDEAVQAVPDREDVENPGSALDALLASFDPSKHPHKPRGKGGGQWARAAQVAAEAATAGVVMEVTETDAVLKLERIVSEHQGEGNASDALDDLVEYADAAGKPVFLNPSALGGLTQEQLVAWYRRHGFAPVGKGMVHDRNAAVVAAVQPFLSDVERGVELA